MSELVLTKHVINRITGNRPLMSELTLRKLARHISDIVDRYNPNSVHQVAVKVYQFTSPRKLGKSEGDCLIIAVDIRKRTIPTVFLRYAKQGKPRKAQVYIDLSGQELS